MYNLKILVDSLYEYRDNFFNLHNISEASDKPRLVGERLASVLEEFEKADDSLRTKAEYFMLKGKALNATALYDSQAEALLSKAVKLDPMLSEAWTCLGDCYWKNDKFDAAKDCFVSSMSHKKNKEALRYLSTITRAVGHEKKSVEDSVQMAKEALKMDLNDGLSWLTLGNAYIAQYFGNLQDPAIIKQALSAYSRAEQDSTTRHNYTLYFNKASAYEYLEKFSDTLSLYHKANQLNPTFLEGASKESELLKYLHEVNTLVHTKGKMRQKRLKALIDKINPSVDVGTFAPRFSKDRVDCFKSIKELSEGSNPRCLLVGRVVGSVFGGSRVCQTFCLVDKDGTCTAVMLYNTSAKWGVCIGDAVVINEPSLKVISIDPCTTPSIHTPVHFSAIRVDFPTHLLVNTRKPTEASITPVSLTQTMHSE